MAEDGTGRGETQFRSYHDMGGLMADRVNPSEHEYDFWEKRVDALMVLLSGPEKQLLRVDELRRAIESLNPEDYDNLGYYERWIRAITTVMVEKGVVSRAELDARIARLKAEGQGMP